MNGYKLKTYLSSSTSFSVQMSNPYLRIQFRFCFFQQILNLRGEIQNHVQGPKFKNNEISKYLFNPFIRLHMHACEDLTPFFALLLPPLPSPPNLSFSPFPTPLIGSRPTSAQLHSRHRTVSNEQEANSATLTTSTATTATAPIATMQQDQQPQQPQQLLQLQQSATTTAQSQHNRNNHDNTASNH